MGELRHGSPAHRPLSSGEEIDWLALIIHVEPEEARARAEALKQTQGQ